MKSNGNFYFFNVPSNKMRYVQGLQQIVGDKEIKFSKKSPSVVKMSLRWLKQLSSSALDELAYGAHDPDQWGENRTGAGISRELFESFVQNKKRNLDNSLNPVSDIEGVAQPIKKLRSVFSGGGVTLSNYHELKLTNDTWSSVFRTILASGKRDLINEIWKNASDLSKNYFLRNVINLGTKEQPYYFRISIADCLVNFRYALRAKACYFITRIWKNNSKDLIRFIQDDPEKDDILNEVRYSLRSGRASKIIFEFEENDRLRVRVRCS